MKKLVLATIFFWLLANTAFGQASAEIKKFFPIYGVTLMETTVDEMRLKKDFEEQVFSFSYGNYHLFSLRKSMSLDQFGGNENGLISSYSCVNVNMPKQLDEKFGININSYDDWIQLFTNWGYIVKTGNATGYSNPYMIKAMSQDGSITFTLNLLIRDSKMSLNDIRITAQKSVPYLPYFPYFIQAYVEEKVKEWQKKGEFEKKEAFQLRVNEKTRNELINKLTAEAEKKFFEDYTKNNKIEFTIGIYDPDNESYLLSSSIYGNYVIKVPIAVALNFKQNNKFNPSASTMVFVDKDFKVGFSKLTFTLDGKNYSYTSDSKVDYAHTKIDYNFEPININVTASNTTPIDKPEIKENTVKVGVTKSDIDQNIPKSATTNYNTFVLIIANQDYQKEKPILTAKNDANSVKNYCIQTLGIPVNNVKYYENLPWKDNVKQSVVDFAYTMQVNPNAKFLVFYFGHGMADPKTEVQDSYLLPTEGSSIEIANFGYSRNEMLQEFSKQNPKQCIVFLESCFSGATPTNEMLAYSNNTSGVRVEEKSKPISGNIVVFSASSKAQTANAYMEEGHNLFTYELLKAIKETNGDISLGTLFEKVSANTARTANNKLNAKQNPTFMTGSTMDESWKNWKLK